MRAILVLLLALISVTVTAQTQTLRLVSTAWPPFTNQPGQPRFALDLVEAALGRIGVSSTTTIVEAVKAIKPSGGTAILDALDDVSERFGDGAGRRVVVLITDGYDERSQGSADEVLEKLKSSRVTVYVISIGGVAGVQQE